MRIKTLHPFNRKNNEALDTLTFENTLDRADYPFDLLTVLAIVAVLGMIAITFSFVFMSYSKKKRYVALLVIGCLTVAGGFLGAQHTMDEYKTENAAALTENTVSLINNLDKKYEIEELVLDPTVNTPYQTSEQNIVVIVGNQEISYLLTQDEKTFEPTLSNPPKIGGSGEVPGADDLLRTAKS